MLSTHDLLWLFLLCKWQDGKRVNMGMVLGSPWAEMSLLFWCIPEKKLLTLLFLLCRNRVLVCPMKSAPVMLTLSDSKHVVLPVDDDSDLNVVASFDRRGEYIYTGNAKGKVGLQQVALDAIALIKSCL